MIEIYVGQYEVGQH